MLALLGGPSLPCARKNHGRCKLGCSTQIIGECSSALTSVPRHEFEAEPLQTIDNHAPIIDGPSLPGGSHTTCIHLRDCEVVENQNSCQRNLRINVLHRLKSGMELT